MTDQEHTDTLSSEEVTRRARSSFLWLASSTALWQVVAWMMTLVTARILAPADYGIMAMIEAVIPYLLLVTDFQLGNWIIQEQRFGAAERKAVQSLCLAFGLSMMLLCAAAAPFTAAFFETPALTSALFALSVIYLFYSLRVVPEAALKRELRFKSIAVMNLVVALTQGVLQVVLAVSGFGFWSLVIGKIYREGAMTIWFLVLTGRPSGFSWDPALVRRALAYGLPATGATVAWIVFSTMDNVIVGKMFGPTVLGAYAMAFFLVDLPMSKLNTVIRPILVSYFSRLRTSPDEVYEALGRLNHLVAAVIFPVLLGLAAAAPEAVTVVLGSDWASMIEPLQVLCVAGLLRSLTSNMIALYQAFGVPQKELILNCVTVLLLVPAFMLLGRLYGLPGIYASWLFVYPFAIAFALVLLQRTTGIRPLVYLRSFYPPCVCSVLMAAGTFLVGMVLSGWQPPLLLAAKVAVGIVLYLGAYLLLFSRQAHEIFGSARGLRS